MKQLLKVAEALQEKYKTPLSKFDNNFTKTAQFMTPAINVKVDHPLVFKFFKNAYLADREHKHNYTRPIFLLFNIDNFKDESWKKLYSILIKSENYIAEYDVGVQDKEYLFMMVFSVPEKFSSDYYNFRNGKYSNFTEEYKKKFPKYIGDKVNNKKNMHWQIINKDSELKNEIISLFDIPVNLLTDEDEIWGKPLPEREFYRYKIKK